MDTYHKINALYKRHLDGPKKGRLIIGEWAQPEFEYLADNEWRYSVKMDGTNIRVEFVPNDGMHSSHVNFGGRSNNAVIPKPLMDHLYNTFDPQVFYDAGLKDTHITLFGEGYGPKIQGGGKYRDDHSFILFDVRVGDFWLSRENVVDVGAKLGIDVVPEVGRGSLYEAIELVTGGLRSQFGDFYEEGLVCRPVVDLFNRKGERIITKVKHVDLHSQ